MWRAITFGCIPVTFFRAFDLPFQRHMGMPYADFVLNIQPDDYRHLNARVQALLDNPTQLRRMQVRPVILNSFTNSQFSHPQSAHTSRRSWRTLRSCTAWMRPDPDLNDGSGDVLLVDDPGILACMQLA